MPFYSPFNKENLTQIPQTKAGKIQPLQRKSKNRKKNRDNKNKIPKQRERTTDKNIFPKLLIYRYEKENVKPGRMTPLKTQTHTKKTHGNKEKIGKNAQIYKKIAKQLI